VQVLVYVDGLAETGDVSQVAFANRVKRQLMDPNAILVLHALADVLYALHVCNKRLQRNVLGFFDVDKAINDFEADMIAYADDVDCTVERAFGNMLKPAADRPLPTSKLETFLYKCHIKKRVAPPAGHPFADLVYSHTMPVGPKFLWKWAIMHGSLSAAVKSIMGVVKVGKDDSHFLQRPPSWRSICKSFPNRGCCLVVVWLSFDSKGAPSEIYVGNHLHGIIS
jgi:hypothetical protein